MEHLDFGHFSGPQHEDILRAYLRGKYRESPINVIVAAGPAGAIFKSFGAQLVDANGNLTVKTKTFSTLSANRRRRLVALAYKGPTFAGAR